MTMDAQEVGAEVKFTGSTFVTQNGEQFSEEIQRQLKD